MSESIQNVILLEGSALGDSGKFVSLAKILASLLPRVLPLGCALGWTDFINPRDGDVRPSEATRDLVHVYPATTKERVSNSAVLDASLLLHEQSRAILQERVEFENDRPCLTGIR